MESIQQEIHRLVVEAFLALHEDWRRVSEQFGWLIRAFRGVLRRRFGSFCSQQYADG